MAKVRLLQEPHKSFIYYKENNPFTKWHNHPEYELCLITKGKGKRMIGDNIDRFEDNDLVFIGAYTPHEILCDPKYFDLNQGFLGEGIVIQFVYDFLGEIFFSIPENRTLDKFIIESSRGYVFYGKAKKQIASIMVKMGELNDIEKFYSLLSIFRIFATTHEYTVLSSPAFNGPFWTDDNNSMHKAIKYIMLNFQKNINIKDLLKVSNMSNTSFYVTFKKTYRMSFKDYLLNIRIGYSCKLLAEGTHSISSIAYQSGFRNLSNFNRQFKKIKGITPSEYSEQVRKIAIKNSWIK